MKNKTDELQATYERVIEAFNQREHRQKRIHNMILGLYFCITLMLFVSAWI